MGFFLCPLFPAPLNLPSWPSSKTWPCWLREAPEVEVLAVAHCDDRVFCFARGAACLPFRVVGELSRKLGPDACVVLVLGMGRVNKGYLPTGDR